jgi:hypothetical protein
MIDEQLARMAAEAYEKKHPADIREGAVKVGGLLLSFEKTGLFEGRLKVFLPAEFADMPEDTAKIKYPSSDRPKIIKTNAAGDVNFTFDTFDGSAGEHSIPEITDMMQKAMKRMNPSYLFFDIAETETESGTEIGYMEFKSSALDDFLYNIMFFAPFGNRTLIGNFSCLYSAADEWKSIVMQILSEIEIAEVQ